MASEVHIFFAADVLIPVPVCGSVISAVCPFLESRLGCPFEFVQPSEVRFSLDVRDAQVDSYKAIFPIRIRRLLGRCDNDDALSIDFPYRDSPLRVHVFYPKPLTR